MAVLNVNTKELIAYSAKLEKLNRSAFPSAVRNTLNEAAFTTKKNIPVHAAGKFVTRRKTFFKKFSRVEKASGFNINSLVSKAGIDSSVGQELLKNLEAHEEGGKIVGRKIVPHDEARTSNSSGKAVRSRNYANKVAAHNASRAFKSHSGSGSSKFVAAVFSTVKAGKRNMFLASGKTKGKSIGMIYSVKGLSKNVKTGKVRFKLKKIYTVRRSPDSSVSGKGYVRSSAIAASEKMSFSFKKHAEFQFLKALK